MIERQIHLDFHTSPDIPKVAAAFDAAAFGDYYRDLAATSVTVFARDHHGYLFYRSQAEPGAMHPTSVVPDLLEQQIAALHARGIRAPIYTTVQWDHRTAKAHPEWLCRDADGRVINTQDVPAPNFYDSLCLNTPYRDYLLAHVSDIIRSVGPANVDGLFFDIVNVVPCACPSCQQTMTEAGLDWHDPQACRQNCAAVLAAFKDEVGALIRRRLPNATIFFNASHVGPGQGATLADYTQLEIESLPNGAWGYDNFSRVARYTRTLGLPYLGMTGKFHTYWGDFHSLKRPAALEFECFQMVSLGAGCSIGDQLLPSGQLLAGTQALIAPVYRRLKALGERLPQTAAVAPIAIVTAEGALTSPAGAAAALTGAVRLLEQAHQQFDIVDATSDWTPYRLLVVLDVLPVDAPGLAAKLQAFIAAGGKVLGCDHAAALGAFGVEYRGRSPWQRDFIQPNAVLGRKLVAEPFVMYETGAAVAAAGSEPVLETRIPYFNREGTTFTSHQHAPSSGVAGVPAAWRTTNTLYFTHPLFTLYYDYAPDWVASLFQDALALLAPALVVATDLPDTARVEVRRAVNGDLYLHVLNYWIQKTGRLTYSVAASPVLREATIALPAGYWLAATASRPAQTPVATDVETGAAQAVSVTAAGVTLHLREVRPYQVIHLTTSEGEN
ncbi:alpha-amylase family protein [Lacticaseibacillus suihuaensis]